MRSRATRTSPGRSRGLDEAVGILALAIALVILAGIWFDRRGLVPQAVSRLFEALGVGTYYMVALLAIVGVAMLDGRRPVTGAAQLAGWLGMTPLVAGAIGGAWLLTHGDPAAVATRIRSEGRDPGPGGWVGLFVYEQLAGRLGDWSALVLLCGLSLALGTFLADMGPSQLVGTAVRVPVTLLGSIHRVVKGPALFLVKVAIALVLGLHRIVFIVLKDLVTLSVRLVGMVVPAQATLAASGEPSARARETIPIVGRAPGGAARSSSAGEAPATNDEHEDEDAEDALWARADRPDAAPPADQQGSGDAPEGLPGDLDRAGEIPAEEDEDEDEGDITTRARSRDAPAQGALDVLLSAPAGQPSAASRAVALSPTESGSEAPSGEPSLCDGAVSEGRLEGQGPPAAARETSGEESPPVDADGPPDGTMTPAVPALPVIQARRTMPRDIPRPPETVFNSAPDHDPEEETEEELRARAARIVETLAHFKIQSQVMQITRGPSVTQFELKPQAGIKLSTISSLSSNLAMALETKSVRIEAPILGKSVVGIEVPNRRMATVAIRKIITSPRFRASRSLLTFAVGEDIAGQPILGDLTRMPHLLVAGATGSGKSVCINAILASILTNAGPDRVSFILIDPKVVELSGYSGIPHLVTDVVTDPGDAAAALKWAVLEMERRYRYLSRFGIRNIRAFNEAQATGALTPPEEATPVPDGPMPYVVVIIDELADLMVVAKKDVEESIMRLTQMARAVGIHLVVATQRPSVNVITGVIKANLPSRIAFAVASKVDSKVILDTVGAEKLLGRGDMLYLPTGEQRPLRIQGAYIDDEEVKRLVGYLKDHGGDPSYQDIVAEVKAAAGPKADRSFNDRMFNDCLRFAIEKGEASTSLFQTYLDIGYNRAARIVEEMEARGLISGRETGKRRKVLIGASEMERHFI